MLDLDRQNTRYHQMFEIQSSMANIHRDGVRRYCRSQAGQKVFFSISWSYMQEIGKGTAILCLKTVIIKVS